MEPRACVRKRPPAEAWRRAGRSSGCSSAWRLRLLVRHRHQSRSGAFRPVRRLTDLERAMRSEGLIGRRNGADDRTRRLEMLKIGFVGVAAVALVTLAACGPKSGAGQPAPYSIGQAGWAAAQGGGQNQMAQSQMAQNPIQGPQQPWQNQGGYPQQPYPQQGGGYPQAQGGYPGAMAPQGGAALQISGAPQGMRPIRARAGGGGGARRGGAPRAARRGGGGV